jgi:hypothetical protein
MRSLRPAGAPYVSLRGRSSVNGHGSERRRFWLLTLRTVLFVLFLLSIYVEVPLNAGFLIPSFFTLLILMPLLALMYYRRVYWYELYFVGQIVLILLLTAFLSPGFEWLGEKLLGLVQTTISIIGGILLLKLVDGLQYRWLTRALFALWVVLLVGAALEVVGILTPVSDSFREAAYSAGSYSVYESDARDISIVGHVRPSLFTTEPSLLAIGFFVFVNSWLVAAYSQRNLLVACIAAMVMLGVSGSPILLLSLAVSLIIMLFSERNVSSLWFSITLAFIGIAVAFYVRPDIASDLTARFSDAYQNIGTLRATSENRRLIYPYITLVDVLKNSPFFGVGISGKELVEDYSSLPSAYPTVMGNNALAMFFIYLGVVGSALFGMAVHDFWRRMGINQPMLLVILILALSQTMGGFETPRFWGYTFLFIGVIWKGSKTRNSTPNRFGRVKSSYAYDLPK